MSLLQERLAGARPDQPAILGIPFDENSSFLRGTAQAPPLIRQALHSSATNLWTEKGTDLGDAGTLADAGDLQFSAAGSAFAEIENAVAEILERKLKPICLGGDHSITYPIVRAIAKHHPDLNILLFDAHPDMYDELQGNRFSHACPFARILEEHAAARLVQVGVRNFNGHQRAQAERFGVKVVEMKDWREDLPLEFSVPLYISFDMDALDPAFAPGVSHHEPGGFTTRQVLAMIQSIEANILGADIVEFNPARDVAGITAAAAAKILKELAARML